MSTPRAYSSEHRRRQAEETRLAIRRAARLLFVASGLAATTVEAIAKKAGVSPATVYATYGSKPAIMVAIIDEMEAESGLREEIPLLLAEPDPRRQLDLFVSGHVRLLVAGADVLRAALEARGEPEVRALLERGDGNRRRGIEALVAGWVERGVLPEAAGRSAVERMWLLTSVESFVLAVDRLGWEAQALERWLAGLLAREVLGPHRPD